MCMLYRQILGILIQHLMVNSSVCKIRPLFKVQLGGHLNKRRALIRINMETVTFSSKYTVRVVVVLLFYVHGKHLRSCWDCQLT